VGLPGPLRGPDPHTPLEQWDFSIAGEVDEPRRWTWDELRALPSEEVTRDIHCVTKWTDTRLLASSRSWDDIIYRAELERLAGGGLTVVHTLTASRPPGWDGYARRVDAAMLAEVGPSPDEQPRVYVCGPTPFVEAVAEALVTLGHEPARIKTERFGPTGD
jgi:ferredoxin-NADP reductase